MSLPEILTYLEYRTNTGRSIAESYGTENFAFFLYSMLLMQQPNTVIELGTGAATTALMAAEALKHNGKGHVWTVDDGSDWRDTTLRQECQQALGYDDGTETHFDFIKRLGIIFGLEDYISPVSMRLEGGEFFSPGPDKVDLLFADATTSNPLGCAALLRYYLPKMAHYSSIFIDRASTIHYSALFLNYIVELLNRARIPMELWNGISDEARKHLRDLVDRSSFSIVHLTETARAKSHSPTQNSRAWIRIEPLDHVHHNDVVNYAPRLVTWPVRWSQ